MPAVYHTHKRVLAGVPDGTPLCAKCKKPHDRKGQRLCRKCHNAYQRQWKADQARMAREFRRGFHGKQTVSPGGITASSIGAAIQIYVVTVKKFGEAKYSASSAQQARSLAWKSCRHVSENLSYAEFVKISAVRKGWGARGMRMLAQYCSVKSPCSVRELRMEKTRFAIPSQKLRRGWSLASDHARVVEARSMSYEEYRPAHAEVGSVYFIGDASGGDTIKIGWSRDPVTRLQQLQVGNPAPLKFLGCVAANRMIEPALHQLFALSYVSGEWFTDPEGSIRRWLQEMTFDQPIERCRWFMASTQLVTWQWDDKALLHRPLFSSVPPE